MRDLDSPWPEITLSLEKRMQRGNDKCLLLAGYQETYWGRKVQLKVNDSLTPEGCPGCSSLRNTSKNRSAPWAFCTETGWEKRLHLGVRKAATTRGQPHPENPSWPNKAAVLQGFGMKSLGFGKMHNVVTGHQQIGLIGEQIRIRSLHVPRVAGNLVHSPGQPFRILWLVSLPRKLAF